MSHSLKITPFFLHCVHTLNKLKYTTLSQLMEIILMDSHIKLILAGKLENIKLYIIVAHIN